MLFNPDFPKNTVLSSLFFFFLIIDRHSLIPAVIAQIFNPTAEFSMVIEIPTKETKPNINIHPVPLRWNPPCRGKGAYH